MKKTSINNHDHIQFPKNAAGKIQNVSLSFSILVWALNVAPN